MTVFIISDSFNYQDYMPDDTGPRFAAMYDWPVACLSDVTFSPRQVYVVDWNLSDREFQIVNKIMRDLPTSLFVFHVVDPGPHIVGTPAYRFLQTACVLHNFGLSGPYLPSEHIAYVYARSCKLFVLTPYLYEPERELPLDHDNRKDHLLVTGNIGLPDYPIRHAINRAGSLNPLLWGRVKRLRHSGYSVAKLRHSFVRDRYITELSQYRFAVVCSSRLRLEFLKYRELAYAGCAPIGDLPGTLMDCPTEGFIPWRRNSLKTLQRISPDNSHECALVYRKYMQRVRDREHWRRSVQRSFHGAKTLLEHAGTITVGALSTTAASFSHGEN
jgi:hypothetical protein